MDMAGEAPMIATAMEFMARASSTSEVLTLNLTNLLILLVLKALIFGFGLFSVGGAGRSLDGPSVSQFDCVQRTVCEDPYLASDYLTAAKMWYKMHNMLKSIVPFSEKYSKIMYAVQEASEYGKQADAVCANKYSW